MDWRDPKAVFRELETLLRAESREGEPARSWQVIVDGFLERFGAELGLTGALVLSERRGVAVRVHSRDWPSEGFQPDGRELAPILAAFAGGERFFVSLHAASAKAGLLADDELGLAIVLFRADASARERDLALALSTLAAALRTRHLEIRLRSTLNAAVEIQQSLLPQSPPMFAGFDVAARSHPAEEVGGDLYDFLHVGDGSLGLAIGDASGHGLPAALVARDVVIGLRMGLEKDLRAGPILTRLNRVIHASSMTSSFVSLFYGELEGNGSLFYYNAGHEPPLLFQDGGMRVLAQGDTVIGPLPDVRFKRHFAHVDRGATLVLYTDGIVERRSREGEFFGTAGIARAVQEAAGRDAAGIVASVFASASTHGASGRWDDDASVIAVKRAG